MGPEAKASGLGSNETGRQDDALRSTQPSKSPGAHLDLYPTDIPERQMALPNPEAPTVPLNPEAPTVSLNAEAETSLPNTEKRVSSPNQAFETSSKDADAIGQVLDQFLKDSKAILNRSVDGLVDRLEYILNNTDPDELVANLRHAVEESKEFSVIHMWKRHRELRQWSASASGHPIPQGPATALVASQGSPRRVNEVNAYKHQVDIQNTSEKNSQNTFATPSAVPHSSSARNIMIENTEGLDLIDRLDLQRSLLERTTPKGQIQLLLTSLDSEASGRVLFWEPIRRGSGNVFWELGKTKQSPGNPSSEDIFLHPNDVGNCRLIVEALCMQRKRKLQLKAAYRQGSPNRAGRVCPDHFEQSIWRSGKPAETIRRICQLTKPATLAVTTFGIDGGDMRHQQRGKVFRRLLLARGFKATNSSPTELKRVYLDVSSGRQVSKDRDDIVFPETEAMFRALSAWAHDICRNKALINDLGQSNNPIGNTKRKHGGEPDHNAKKSKTQESADVGLERRKDARVGAEEERGTKIKTEENKE